MGIGKSGDLSYPYPYSRRISCLIIEPPGDEMEQPYFLARVTGHPIGTDDKSSLRETHCKKYLVKVEENYTFVAVKLEFSTKLKLNEYGRYAYVC